MEKWVCVSCVIHVLGDVALRTSIYNGTGPGGPDRRKQQDGTALRQWGVQSIFRRLKDRAGIPNLHAHLLRHNFAKKAARAGAGRSELQDVLAHRNPSMTLRYLGDVAKEIAAQNMVRYSPLK